MLLIDASNLGGGGGVTLLKCLLDAIVDRDFQAIVSRKSGVEASRKIAQCDIASPLGKKRQAILETYVAKVKPSRILFFGNLPPLKKFENIDTLTYFQNALLIGSLSKGFQQPILEKIKLGLLRRFIKKNRENTDHWIFQTNCVRDSFVNEYMIPGSNTHVYPFFDGQQLKGMGKYLNKAQDRHGFVYLSDAYAHKNHIRLLEAWAILNNDFNRSPALHLTINNPAMSKLINKLNEGGCQIINHGTMPRGEALALAATCEFTVFPSLLETIGLGMVEGAMLGTKVVCSNIAAFEEVIEPSATFDGRSPQSIAKTINHVLTEAIPDSSVLLENKLKGLVDFLFH